MPDPVDTAKPDLSTKPAPAPVAPVSVPVKVPVPAHLSPHYGKGGCYHYNDIGELVPDEA